MEETYQKEHLQSKSNFSMREDSASVGYSLTKGQYSGTGIFSDRNESLKEAISSPAPLRRKKTPGKNTMISPSSGNSLIDMEE
jgi:hypothetical protein